jgi:Hemingway/CFA97
MSSIMRVKAGASAAEAADAQARYAKSLNRESRKRELQKITKENARILHAIQSSEPFYDHTKWEVSCLCYLLLLMMM